VNKNTNQVSNYIELTEFEPIPQCGLNPNAVAGCLSNEFLTTIDAEMFNKNILGEVVNCQPAHNNMTMMNLMMNMGGMVPVCGEVFGHREAKDHFESIKIAEVQGGAAAGDDACFVLDPSSVMEYGPANAMSTSSPARPGFVGHKLFNGQLVYFIIKSVDTSGGQVKLIVAPWGECADEWALADVFRVKDCIPLIFNTFAKCACVPQGMISGHHRYQNTLQIIKEFNCTCDSDVAQCFTVKFKDAAGNSHSSYWTKMGKDMEYRFKAFLNSAILLGQQNHTGITQGEIAGIDTEAPNAPLTGTTGMIPYAMMYGIAVPTKKGRFNYDTFCQVNNQLEAEGAPSTYCVVMGNGAMQSFQRSMKDRATGYGDAASKFIKDVIFDGCEMQFERVRFAGFQCGERMFVFKALPGFSRKDWLGSAGYTDFFIGFPWDVDNFFHGGLSEQMQGMNCPNPMINQKDDYPPMMIRYRADPKKGYSRLTRYTRIGDLPASYGPGRVNPNHCDVSSDSVMAEVGFHGMCGNQWFFSDLSDVNC